MLQIYSLGQPSHNPTETLYIFSNPWLTNVLAEWILHKHQSISERMLHLLITTIWYYIMLQTTRCQILASQITT